MARQRVQNDLPIPCLGFVSHYPDGPWEALLILETDHTQEKQIIEFSMAKFGLTLSLAPLAFALPPDTEFLPVFSEMRLFL